MRGQLLDTNGIPIGDAFVWIQPACCEGARRAYTDPDGNFRFYDVPPGEYQIHWRTVYGIEAGSEELLQVGTNGLRSVIVRSPPTIVTSGRVEGLRPGEARGLGIRAVSSLELSPDIKVFLEPQARVSPDGSFRFAGLPRGEWRITASTKDWRRIGTTLTIDPTAKPSEVVLSLPTGFTLTGNVRWPDQHIPPDEFRVRVTSPNYVTERRASFRASEPFVIHDLPPGRYAVELTQTGFWSPHYSFVEIRDDKEVQVPIAGGSISGTVVDALTGVPISDADLNVHPVAKYNQHSNQEAHRTDRNGRFRMGPWIAGDWHMRVTAPGYATRWPVLTLGETDLADVRLLMQPAERLPIEVVPSPGLRPYRTHGSWFDLETGEMIQIYEFENSGESLTMHWPGAPRGRGILRVTRYNPRRSARVEVNNDGSPIRVTLQRVVDLRVRVLDLESDRPSRAVLYLFDADGHPVVAERGFGNRYFYGVSPDAFRVPNLLRGNYTFRIETTDGRWWNGEADVDGESTNELLITEPPTRTERR